jgi:serine/threonine protein kinase
MTGIAPADLPQKDLRIQFRDRVSLDPSFVAWIEKFVEPDVADRFQSAEEALDALRSPSNLTRTHRSALSVSQPRSLRPPQNTQVIVQQSNQELCITLPGMDFKQQLIRLIGLIIMFLGMSYVPFAMLIHLFSFSLLVGLGILAFSLFVVYTSFVTIRRSSSPTFIHFKSNKFFIYRNIFSKTSILDHGLITDIEDVFHTLKTVSSGRSRYESRVVVIQTSSGEACFGWDLSYEECSWLVDVIRNWLDR